MRNIKVFIASSAELDEDKLQMDLYFSQKNKGYRQRDINFEQRTWRDFPSYLSEEHLQSRYDDYIRQCDIVISSSIPVRAIYITRATSCIRTGKGEWGEASQNLYLC